MKRNMRCRKSGDVRRLKPEMLPDYIRWRRHAERLQTKEDVIEAGKRFQ